MTAVEAAPSSRTGAAPVDAEVVEALLDLVSIPSVSCYEKEAAQRFVEIATAWGLQAHVDEAGNPQAWTSAADDAEGPTVLMLSHVDTVPGGPPPRLVDGVVWGRGSVDAKGPLVAMLAAAARHVARGGRGRLGVIGAVEEETPRSAGAVWVRENVPVPDAVVVGEPSGSDAVTLGYRGKVDLACTTEAAAKHPAHPGEQAAEILLDHCAEVMRRHRTTRDPGFDVLTPTVTSITADARRASCELSFRTPPSVDVDELVDEVSRIDPRVHVEVLNAIAAVRVRGSDPVAAALCAAIAAEGCRPRRQVKTGTSDMNTLAQTWSTPMATFGPGDAAMDHTDDERLPVAELLTGTRVLERALGILTERLRNETKETA